MKQYWPCEYQGTTRLRNIRKRTGGSQLVLEPPSLQKVLHSPQDANLPINPTSDTYDTMMQKSRHLRQRSHPTATPKRHRSYDSGNEILENIKHQKAMTIEIESMLSHVIPFSLFVIVAFFRSVAPEETSVIPATFSPALSAPAMER